MPWIWRGPIANGVLFRNHSGGKRTALEFSTATNFSKCSFFKKSKDSFFSAKTRRPCGLKLCTGSLGNAMLRRDERHANTRRMTQCRRMKPKWQGAFLSATASKLRQHKKRVCVPKASRINIIRYTLSACVGLSSLIIIPYSSTQRFKLRPHWSAEK